MGVFIFYFFTLFYSHVDTSTSPRSPVWCLAQLKAARGKKPEFAHGSLRTITDAGSRISAMPFYQSIKKYQTLHYDS